MGDVHEPAPDGRAAHWDAAYGARGSEGVSWYQAEPRVSLELVEALAPERDAAVLDVGAGASWLAARLVDRGYGDVTVLDLSAVALEEARRRAGDREAVHCALGDVLGWQPPRRYAVWHDRAVLHFLLEDDEVAGYLRTLRRAISPGGGVVIATFAPDGPEACSGLPVRRYAAEELAALLGPGFVTMATRREEHVTPGGAVQPFTWIAGRLGPAA